MEKVLRHFKKQDPTLYKHAARLQKNIKLIQKDNSANYFYRLCREIICQQLSMKAGSAILERFTKLFESAQVAPENVLHLSHEQLRAVGMSNAKARYVKNLAEHVVSGRLEMNSLDELTDEGVVSALTKVKGIGPWTAEMFLMFVLGRPNVFSFGDLGLKKGLMKVYGFKAVPTKAQTEKIIAAWSPYKTYGALVLWACLDE
jgi:DNA-3-methyladenine glycosylase II